MKFPLDALLISEAKTFALRSSCGDCFYFVKGKCAHEWPDEGQSRTPIYAPDADGTVPTEAAFCKEFELA